MEIKLNKEIREYTESIFFGLTMRQCFFSVLACIGAVIVYFLTIDTLGMEITSWLCILVAIPLAALGFATYQGMNAEEIAVLVKGLHNLYDFLHEAVLANQEGK